MEWRDIIPVACVLLMAGLTYWTSRHLERVKNSFQRTLKRYDLLNVERFKTLDQVDDRLVDVQQAMFEHHVSLHKQTPSQGHNELEGFKAASLALSKAKVKSEKYFDQDFNEQFGKLVGEVQTVLMHAQDLRGGSLNEQQAGEVFNQLNKKTITVREQVAEFRKLMAKRIQDDLDL